MNQPYSVDLNTIARECRLTPVFLSDDHEQVRIVRTDVNRPGLMLAGITDYFDPGRIQIIGKMETTFLGTLQPELQRSRLDRLMGTGIRMVVMSHMERPEQVPAVIVDSARRHQVNLFCIDKSTTEVMGLLIIKLSTWLAPRTLMHGVLMEISGEGVLITGESGVGKSESAMALLRRGHRLVADDAVDIRRVHNSLIGNAPEMIRYFMEVRGIGVVDARHLFGVGAVKPEQAIDLVVKFELWDEKKTYDRLGIDTQDMDILGVKVPLNVIPVRPGRNLADILELAAMNNREKKMGYNAAEILVRRYDNMIDEGAARYDRGEA